ncbi:MAG: hypothetical protein FWC32_06620 [Firmicutes bacterium]|nr:hypothetical protein [Bacillota bacterium]
MAELNRCRGSGYRQWRNENVTEARNTSIVLVICVRVVPIAHALRVVLA